MVVDRGGHSSNDTIKAFKHKSKSPFTFVECSHNAATSETQGRGSERRKCLYTKNEI